LKITGRDENRGKKKIWKQEGSVNIKEKGK
jgi:hypothetical protein